MSEARGPKSLSSAATKAESARRGTGANNIQGCVALVHLSAACCEDSHVQPRSCCVAVYRIQSIGSTNG
eukprot:scaffold62517_cov19-Prasinocladus_malaysianus.AAC.1